MPILVFSQRILPQFRYGIRFRNQDLTIATKVTIMNVGKERIRMEITKIEKEPKRGGRVEMFDGTCQGTIAQVVNPHYLIIKWDDGEIGNVHPNDVKHIK